MGQSSTSPAKHKHVHAVKSYVSQLKDRFHSKHKTASKWLKDKAMGVGDLRTTSQQLLAAASLAGSVAMNQPVDAMVTKLFQDQALDPEAIQPFTESERQEIITKLQEYVQRTPGHLESEEELYLEQQLTDLLGFEVTAELEGKRLNHSIGIMGGEQHLRRFPDDSLAQHDAYQEAGIAPARGAFGWFTEQGVLTEQAIQNEKYYFAVQTLYLPDWNTNYPELKPWYKFRKMIVVNPADEIAVVGVVGDAGPAQWVQKQFGGSPEIIRDGKIWSKEARGRVLLYFVNDPDDSVPLGVIDLKQLHQELEESGAHIAEIGEN